MKLQERRSNVSGIKIALAVAAAILVGYLGYMFYTNYKASREEAIGTKAEDVRPAPAISDQNDLDDAASAIEQAEVESGNMDDMTEIEKELSEF